MTKNNHFLKLCQEGQLGLPVNQEKSVTKNDHFLKLCQKQTSYHIFVNIFKELFDKKQWSEQIGKNVTKNEHFLKLCP